MLRVLNVEPRCTRWVRYGLVGDKSRDTDARSAAGRTHLLSKLSRKQDMTTRSIVVWRCTKVCTVCGVSFQAVSGNNKMCDYCRSRPCPQCGRPVVRWSKGVCDICYQNNRCAGDPEKFRLWRKCYYALNTEVLKHKSALRRIENPSKIHASSVRYYSTNKVAISQRARERNWKLRLETVAAYDGKCEHCEETEPKFLCIDHSNDNGKLDRSLGLGGVALYTRLKKQGWPRNDYRLLCYNCNMARELERKMMVIPKSAIQTRHTRKIKVEVVAAYGGKCSCCGETDTVRLAIDHINGNGIQDRDKLGRGRVMYVHLRKLGYPKDDYQLLCHNCNMSKGFWGVCPHQERKVTVLVLGERD